MIGVLGYAVSSLLFGLSSQLWMLFASRALSGVLSSATLVTSMAYVGDTTTADERGKGMGILGAAMALGVILGPGLGGWLAGDSLSRPFFIAAALSLLALLLIFLLLPESLAAEDRRKGGGRIGSVNLRELWQALASPIGVLLLMVALFSFALTNFEAVFGLYALKKFSYGPEQVGSILMVIAIVSTVGKATLTGPTTKRWGEPAVIKASLLAGSVGFLALLLANNFITILLATAFFILSKTLLRPAALALISKRTTGGQGAAMGLSNSFISLGRIAGPVWAGFAFDANVNYPYLSGSAIMFIGFLLALVLIAPRGTEPSVEGVEKAGMTGGV
jgi:DHA1 family multidrug resistance protein-like MFS transporter